MFNNRSMLVGTLYLCNFQRKFKSYFLSAMVMKSITCLLYQSSVCYFPPELVSNQDCRGLCAVRMWPSRVFFFGTTLTSRVSCGLFLLRFSLFNILLCIFHILAFIIFLFYSLFSLFVCGMIFSLHTLVGKCVLFHCSVKILEEIIFAPRYFSK